MSIHTRLVGAFDAIIMSMTAVLAVMMLAALFNPVAAGRHAAEDQAPQDAILAHVVVEAARLM